MWAAKRLANGVKLMPQTTSTTGGVLNSGSGGVFSITYLYDNNETDVQRSAPFPESMAPYGMRNQGEGPVFSGPDERLAWPPAGNA